MSAAAQNATVRQDAFDIDAGQSDSRPALVIDRFDYWHNQPDSLLRPTSITWSDPVTITGRAA